MMQKALKKGHGNTKIAALVAVIIIAAAAAVLYALSGQKAINQPAMPNTGQPLPSAFSSVNLSNPNHAAAELSDAILSSAPNAPQQSALYQGNVYGHLSGVGSILPISAHVTIVYSKHGSNASITANVTGLPLVGPLELQMSNSTSGGNLCSNLNTTALHAKNYLSVRTSSLTCNPLLQYGLNFGELQRYNASLIQQEALQYGVYVNYTNIYQSEFENQSCTYILGTLSQPSLNGTGVFSFCLSDSTFLPLTTYTAFKNSQASVYLLLNQT